MAHHPPPPPGQFHTIVANTGLLQGTLKSTALSEFFPAPPVPLEYDAALTALTEHMQNVTWNEVYQLMAQFWHNLPDGVSARMSVLLMEHESPASSVVHLDLKGDKDKTGPARPNMHANALLATRMVCETDPRALMDELAVLFTAAYKSPTADADLLIYDTLCVCAVLQNIPAFKLLYEASSMCVGPGNLKSVLAQQQEVAIRLAAQPGVPTIAIIAEAPSVAVANQLVGADAPTFHLRNNLDPCCCMSMIGVNLGLGKDMSSQFQEFMALGPVPHPTWSVRIIAAGCSLKNDIITIGVHWHTVPNLDAYVVHIAGLIDYAKSFLVDMVICAGDFNFKDVAAASYVMHQLDTRFRIKCSATKEGVPVITTSKRRTPLQCQHKKANVQISSARICEFYWEEPPKGGGVPPTFEVVPGGVSGLPNKIWPLDHAALRINHVIK
jgi:hypothetical protein